MEVLSQLYQKHNTPVVMTIAFGAILILLSGFAQLLKLKSTTEQGNWLPSKNNLAKRQFEIFALKYTVQWIAAFGVVVALQLYEKFTERGYMALCVSLSLPFLLQPFVWPLDAEKNLPFYLRYSFKANLWIAIFSFIGNYWYTHYFYSVLTAEYTFPAHRLNDVPISLFFATHFYFVTYHTFSNLILRKIETRYAQGILRSIFFWSSIFAFAYFTAFMETLSISSFRYYSFKASMLDIYLKGSAFYGIYFIVSYPVFYRIDEKVDFKNGTMPHTVFQTVMEVMGTGMIVLLLLDFCRIGLGVPLNIKGDAFTCYNCTNATTLLH